MKPLALVLFIAAPSFAAKLPFHPTPTAESVADRLAADDTAGALADAEAAVAQRGGASTYAARGDAKLASGRFDESIADYREAARLDAKYKDKYEGLLVQRDSQANPAIGMSGGGLEMKNFSDVLAKALMAVGVVFLIVIVGETLFRGWKEP